MEIPMGRKKKRKKTYKAPFSIGFALRWIASVANFRVNESHCPFTHCRFVGSAGGGENYNEHCSCYKVNLWFSQVWLLINERRISKRWEGWESALMSQVKSCNDFFSNIFFFFFASFVKLSEIIAVFFLRLSGSSITSGMCTRACIVLIPITRCFRATRNTEASKNSN